MAAVDRTKTPWLIVSIHRPLYSDFAQGSEFEKAANLTRALEPILFENSVDLVLTAHIHNWQRSCPAAKGGCVGAGVQAPVHIATPSAGEFDGRRRGQGKREREKREKRDRAGRSTTTAATLEERILLSTLTDLLAREKGEKRERERREKREREQRDA